MDEKYAKCIPSLENHEELDRILVNLIKMDNHDYAKLPHALQVSGPYLKDREKIEEIKNGNFWYSMCPIWTKREIIEILTSIVQVDNVAILNCDESIRIHF